MSPSQRLAAELTAVRCEVEQLRGDVNICINLLRTVLVKLGVDAQLVEGARSLYPDPVTSPGE